MVSIINKIRAIEEQTMPAIAIPFAFPFWICSMPRTMETTARGMQVHQRQQVISAIMPQTIDAIPNPELGWV